MVATTILILVVLGLAFMNAFYEGRDITRIAMNAGSGFLAAILLVHVAHVFLPETFDGPCKWTVANLQRIDIDDATWLSQTTVCQKET